MFSTSYLDPEVMTFPFVVANIEERFGQAPHRDSYHVLFNFMTQGSKECLNIVVIE